MAIPDAKTVRLLDWAGRWRRDLQDELRLLERGHTITHDTSSGQAKETTKATISQVKARLAELDEFFRQVEDDE